MNIYPSIKVSVCVQTYNQKDYIRECLDSILGQKTNFYFEILLGEDDSTDGTKEICESYAKHYPAIIRLFQRKEAQKIWINGVKTSNFNVRENLQEAKGIYIAFCEGDDYWTDSNKLQKQVDFLEVHPEYSLCFHKTIVKYEDKSRATHLFNNHLLKAHQSSFDVSILLSPKMPIHTSSIVGRNIPELTIYNWNWEVYSSDIATAFIWGKHGKFKCLDEPMSVYRKHDSNFTNQISLRKYIASYIQLFKAGDKYLDFNYHKTIRKLLAYYFLKDAKLAVKEKLQYDALKSLIEAMKSDVLYLFKHLKSTIGTMISIIILALRKETVGVQKKIKDA